MGHLPNPKWSQASVLTHCEPDIGRVIWEEIPNWENAPPRLPIGQSIEHFFVNDECVVEGIANPWTGSFKL